MSVAHMSLTELETRLEVAERYGDSDGYGAEELEEELDFRDSEASGPAFLDHEA